MSRRSKLLARRAMHALRKQISSLYERKTTCDKPGGRYVAKMTPVGFEPTPFRNGALSPRLRPLGQSVHEVSIICMEIAYLEGTSPRLHHEGPCTAKTPTMGSTHDRKVKGFALCRLSQAGIDFHFTRGQ